MIRVLLPAPLRLLASVDGEVKLAVRGEATPASVVAALELAYPALRGTIVDPQTGRRRPFLRFYADGEDLSLGALSDPLPDAIASGAEPLIVLGAIAGG